VETELDDAACFLYTGGTTGLAKGAHLTHRNLVANALQIKSWLTDLKEGAEIGLAVLPFFHSYGMSTCLNLSLVAGGTLILVPRFSQEEILKLITPGKTHPNARCADILYRHDQCTQSPKI
jgi:long-chain acyl-CoA synthetase